MRNTIRKPSSVLIGFGFAVGLTALPVSSASASLPIPDAWPLTVVTAANFDGSRLVVSYIVDGTHIARRLDRATGQSIELPEFVAISGDTSTLITTDGRWLDVDTGEVNLLDGIDLATVELSADGRTYIATSTDRRTGWVVDAATRTRTPLPIQGTPRSMSSNARWVLINTACVTDAGGSMVMCDVVRWDRVTGNRSTVAVRGGREFVASDIADNGRVLVGRRPAYEATYSASDPGTPLRRVGVVYGGTSGHLSSDGEIFLADVHVTLCCRGVTALRVSDGTVLASRGVEWSGLPGIVAVQMTGDGRHLIETVLHYRPTANTTYADPYNTYEVEDLDGQPARALHANQVVWISTAGVTGIGADATPVVLNLTVVDPAHDGFLTVWPCGLSRPLASNVNFGAGTTVGSEVFAGVGSGGHVCVSSNVDVNVVIDAQGWFDTSSPYRPVVPFRLLDTRGADTSGTAHVVSGTEIVVPIAGVATIGADASSAVLSVIVTNPAAAGFLTVWPCGQTRPIASNVNFDVGETRANTVLATLGTDGRVCMASNADVDVVVDAQGWFPTPAPYRGGTPQRIADTRGGEVDAAANLAAGSRVVISARTGAAATMLNIAATNPAADGFATVWPCDQPQPFVSNLNFTAGETTANAVLAGAAADGTICIASSVDVDLIVDVQGDFDADAGYHSVAPFRLLDTRI